MVIPLRTGTPGQNPAVSVEVQTSDGRFEALNRGRIPNGFSQRIPKLTSISYNLENADHIWWCYKHDG